MKYYLRFGLWPNDERSGIYLGSGEPIYEKGVSVYEVTWDKNKQRWEIFDEAGTYTFHPTLMSLIYEEPIRDMYLVTGDEVGEGADGEPLLRNLKIVKRIGLKDIYNPQTYDKEAILDLESFTTTPKQILILYKAPGSSPELKEIATSLDPIKKLVGSDDIDWVNVGNDILLFVVEDPSGLRPNFAIEQPVDPKLLEEAKERLQRLGTELLDSKGNAMTFEEMFTPRPQMIFGNAVFAKLRHPDEVDTSQYPWPFNEEIQENFEIGEDLPSELEFHSLSEDDLKLLQTVIKF